MRIVVEIPPELEGRIQELIHRGKFSDFDQFVSTAFRNQVLAERGGPSWSLSPSFEPSPGDSGNAGEMGILPRISHLLDVPPAGVQTFPPMAAEEVVSYSDPLWGQFYRYLPLKVGVRVLSNARSTKHVPMDEFYHSAADTAERFRWHLSDSDRLSGKGVGEKLATSFPKGGRRSRLRYISQFLLGIRPTDGRVDGFMSRLAFASVRKEPEGMMISPTSWGLEFARIKNPVIDDNGTRPLSEEESGFLLRHISKNVKPEHEHMFAISKALSAYPLTGGDLTQRLRGFYESFQTEGAKWSLGMTNTMRSGATSRMVELGLIRRTRLSRGVPFELTETGAKWVKAAEKNSSVGGRP